MQDVSIQDQLHIPWNKGKVTGQKPPLKRNEIWAIRVRLQLNTQIRDLALFNLAIRRQIQVQKLEVNDYLFPSRIDRSRHLSTRQYAKLLKAWVEDIGLDPGVYGTHSLR